MYANPGCGLGVQRRRLVTLVACTVQLPIAACDRKTQWHETDVSGSLPPLAFSMTDAMTGALVTAADFGGKVTLPYFGYTLSPTSAPPR